jgi:dipeptidase E
MRFSFDGEILLAGGGDEMDSWLIDARLVEQIGRDAAMGYIPVAMTPEYYADCEEWITAAFDEHGFSDIRMWTELGEINPSDMESVSAVYIGGGNTYRLLDKLRNTNTDRQLRQFVADGGYLYGGSAGAIICGETIETTSDENLDGLTDPTGLKLLPDTDIWCHYADSDESEIHKYVTESDRTVVAIPERSGVSVTVNRCRVIGYAPIRVFNNGGKRIKSPGEQFDLNNDI